ncbi:MAG: DUF1146 domain-containing protein [Candidatus Izemoplasmatales bacterium]|jgi:uncharacterized integral membrane protein (TIGR02327 family)|nr:DUF1146 domain-containing protein [Candidatus Izemoplasmatales bacterium]MDD3865228.1 DUF1146 domain-containing protein [Candidatus Izemoplasmatales bacterium]
MNDYVFSVLRIVLFFIATPFVFKALQAVDFSRLFKANSSNQIRLIIIFLSVIIGYFFIDVLVSLFEYVNSLV